MRYCKLLLMGGIVLAFTMPAEAISFNQAWNGPTQWTLVNWDSGSLYTVPVSTPTTSVGVFSPPVPGAGAVIDGTHISGYEDSWGVLQVVSIYKGRITTSGAIVRETGAGSLLWQEGITDNRELIGTFWGLEDLTIATSSSGVQTIESRDLTFRLYDQKYGTFSAAGEASLGSSDRIGTGYDGIGPNSIDGTAVPWMEASTVAGFVGVNAASEFLGNFNPNALSGAPGGDALFYVEVDPTVGQGGALYAPGNYYSNPSGTTADLRLFITTTAENPSNTVGGFDWTVTTTDDVDGAMVPEPVTMASLFLGLGCLGRYIRKRR